MAAPDLTSTDVTSTDLSGQAAQAEAAIAAGRGDAHDWMLIGLHRSARHDDPGADEAFARALALEPHNPAILTGQAIHLRRQGRIRDAVLACDAAISAWPTYADAWLERGSLLALGGSPAARDSFVQAAALDPAKAAAHAGIAAIDARAGRAASARASAERALALDPGNALATCALASLANEEGDALLARSLLEPLVAALPEPGSDRSLAYGMLGDACHKLGDHGAAYRAYAACKADFAAINTDAAAGHLSHREFVEAIHAGLGALPAEAWPVPSPGRHPLAAERHLFVLGYPRSGNTLLENVLASIPGVHALEERPTLSAADRAYLAGSPAEIVTGLAAFAQLPEAALDQYRQAYWEKVRASGVPADAAAFVDMDPLKGTRLPFIARLFPEARIVLIRRDPRDVVWSCFRTNFALASGTLDYTSLERTARHYDAMMRLTGLALERLPLQVHTVHYHQLVQQFDETTRAICAFTGLDWSASVRDFAATAQSRGVSTASVGQVRRGLFDGTRQWEPYSSYLEPVMPLLQPWVRQFGYD